MCIWALWIISIKSKKEWLRYGTALWTRRCSRNVGMAGVATFLGLVHRRLELHGDNRHWMEILKLRVFASLLSDWHHAVLEVFIFSDTRVSLANLWKEQDIVKCPFSWNFRPWKSRKLIRCSFSWNFHATWTFTASARNVFSKSHGLKSVFLLNREIHWHFTGLSHTIDIVHNFEQFYATRKP